MFTVGLEEGTHIMFDMGTVPPIPPTSTEPVVSQHKAVLLWCFAGEATVDLDALTYQLTAGLMLWVPPGYQTVVKTAAESVLFPIFILADLLPHTLTKPRLLVTPQGAEDWLIFHFARGLNYLRGAVSQSLDLVDLVAHVPASTSDQGVLLPPRMPKSPEALELAKMLLSNPAHLFGLRAFAATLRTSQSTLKRQFVEETGLSFGRWRTQVRLAVAAAFIAHGEHIGKAASKAGFDTTSGFTRAFVGHTGITPTEYRRCHVAPAGVASRSSQRFIRQLASITTENASDGDEKISIGVVDKASFAGGIPPTETWSRVNHFHIVVWAYRGSARVSVTDRTWELVQGDAMLLPAGRRVHVAVAAGSLLLPLGQYRGGVHVNPDRLTVTHFDSNAELYLLHTVVANFTLSRPDHHDPYRIATSFMLQATGPTGGGLSTTSKAVRQIMDSLMMEPANSRELADWAQYLHADLAALRREFFADTGTTFRQWRAQCRMTWARQLLRSGVSVETVARRVGYRHHSGFTRAFIAAHGVSPTEYRTQQIQ